MSEYTSTQKLEWVFSDAMASEGLGDGSPQRVPGTEPRWRSEKHDINFALRITLMHAYYPFYSSSVL